MTFATIDALRESLARPTPKVRTPEYIAKMLHTVPESTVVDRVKFIMSACEGKHVLEFGASGLLHVGIKTAAKTLKGVDIVSCDESVIAFDLDDVRFSDLPLAEPDLIVCGEILEHLSNPGWFLTRLRRQYEGVPVIVTVPNAFSEAGRKNLEDEQLENVNIDHVAWYSYRTLLTLLERHGFQIEAFHWYKGEPYTAEGLIMVAR